MKIHVSCSFEPWTSKNKDFSFFAWWNSLFAFFDIKTLNSGHSYFNINYHIDMKSSLSKNLKSFLYETRAKSDARCYFRAIIWDYSQFLHVLLPWTQIAFWPFTPLDVRQLPIFCTFLAFIHIREPSVLMSCLE